MTKSASSFHRDVEPHPTGSQELSALDAWNARLKPKFTQTHAIRFALRNQLIRVCYHST